MSEHGIEHKETLQNEITQHDHPLTTAEALRKVADELEAGVEYPPEANALATPLTICITFEPEGAQVGEDGKINNLALTRAMHYSSPQMAIEYTQSHVDGMKMAAADGPTRRQ